MARSMTAEQTKLLFALTQAKKAYELLEEAYSAFEEVGIKINSFNYADSNRGVYHTANTVLLSNGINNLSLLTQTEIDGSDADWGELRIHNMVFHQFKLPVEKVDRYA